MNKIPFICEEKKTSTLNQQIKSNLPHRNILKSFFNIFEQVLLMTHPDIYTVGIPSVG